MFSARQGFFRIGSSSVLRPPTFRRCAAIPDFPTANVARSVLPVLTDGVLTHDVTGRIVEWNDAAPRCFFVVDDALASPGPSNPLFHAVHDDGAPWPIETQPAQLALYQGRQVRDETMGIRRPDGSFTWLRVNAYPIHDDEGVVEGATTIFNDITEIFERASSQQASQRRFLTTFERSPVASLVVDPHGKLLAANAAFAMLVGRSVAELVAIDRFALAELGISMHLFNALTSPERNGTNAALIRVPTSRRRDPLRADADLCDRLAGLRPVLDGPSRRHHRACTVAARARAQRQPLPGDVRFVTDRSDDLRARRCRQAGQLGDGPAPLATGRADRRAVGRRIHPPRGTAPGEAVRGQGDEPVSGRRGSIASCDPTARSAGGAPTSRGSTPTRALRCSAKRSTTPPIVDATS